jgi:hypothetical protein
MGDNPSKEGAPNLSRCSPHDDAVSFCEKATVLMRAAKLIDATQIVRPRRRNGRCRAGGDEDPDSFGDVKTSTPTRGTPATRWERSAGRREEAECLNLFDVHGYLWSGARRGMRATTRRPRTDRRSTAGSGGAKLRGGSWKDPAGR